jgi:hypothetical protein
MLAVQVSPRRKVWVSLANDTKPNKGGYYCQVYNDPMCEDEIDNFVVHNYEIPSYLTDENERRKKAMAIANYKTKQMFA